MASLPPDAQLGVIASRRDSIPLIVIEVVGFVLILLSLAMAAVETGTKEVGRNAAIGVAGLLIMAVIYAALQRLKPVRANRAKHLEPLRPDEEQERERNERRKLFEAKWW